MLNEAVETTRKELMGGLAKGLDVLLAFDRAHTQMTLSEIAEIVELPPATARRCLLTLQELGYVARSGKKYLLRPKVLDLGAAYLESMNIGDLTKTYLQELADETGDSASLAVLDDTDVVYLAHASVRTLFRLEARIGSRFPAFATSMGRVLLAGLPPARLAHFFETAKFEMLTSKTETRPHILRALIEQTAKDGYSAVEDELAYGVVAVAVPVMDAKGRVVAAINSSGHSKKTNKANLVAERLDILRSTSAKISRELLRFPGISLALDT